MVWEKEQPRPNVSTTFPLRVNALYPPTVIHFPHPFSTHTQLHTHKRTLRITSGGMQWVSSS